MNLQYSKGMHDNIYSAGATLFIVEVLIENIKEQCGEMLAVQYVSKWVISCSIIYYTTFNVLYKSL